MASLGNAKSGSFDNFLLLDSVRRAPTEVLHRGKKLNISGDLATNRVYVDGFKDTSKNLSRTISPESEMISNEFDASSRVYSCTVSPYTMHPCFHRTLQPGSHARRMTPSTDKVFEPAIGTAIIHLHQ